MTCYVSSQVLNLLTQVSCLEAKNKCVCVCCVAFEDLSSNPGHCIMLMDVLLAKSSVALLPYRNALVSSLPRLLDQNVPRYCQDLAVRIWNKMNGIFPSR